MELPDIKLDFWTILFLIAGAQSCFISLMILVFNRKKQEPGTPYLVAFLFLFGYMLIFNFCYWTNFLYSFPVLFHTIFPLNYVFGPLLLLYFDSQRASPRLQTRWFFHFLPFLLILVHLLPFYLLEGPSKLQVIGGQIPFPPGLLPPYFGYMLMPKAFGSFMVIYFIWKIKVFLQIIEEDKLSGKSKEFQLIRKRWFLLLLSLYAAFFLSYLIYFMISDKDFFTLNYDYAITAVMTLAIYALAYLGIRRSFIFSGEIHQKVFSQQNKYGSSSLSGPTASSLAAKITSYMEAHKPYLENKLTLKGFAKHLGMSPHLLSQVINDHMGKTFNQYINEYRIQEAKSLLSSPSYAGEHIIQIAYQCGFNNKTTFNLTFKKIVGTTPSAFRKKVGAKT